MSKLQELFEQFSTVFSGRGANVLDSIAPLFIFLVVNRWLGINIALLVALGAAALFALYRIRKKGNINYALGGFAGAALAAAFVKLSGSEAGFFLPGLITDALTVILSIVSVLINRPLAAWSSFITRRWPLRWYWHPKVLPAYNEVTTLWAAAFAGRLFLTYRFYQQEAIGILSTIKVFLGWPFIITLLAISYLYGVWRLDNLQGPSTEELTAGKAPPWQGQKRGF